MKTDWNAVYSSSRTLPFKLPHQLPFTFVPPYFFCSSWPCFFFFWKTFKILGLFWKRCNDYLQIVQSQGFNVRTIQSNSNFFTKARFRRRTFHEPNLIHWIKYMKSSASQSIRNAYFNCRSSPAGNFDFGTTLERLWFRPRTFHVLNLMHKLL